MIKKCVMLFLLLWCAVAQGELVNRYSFTTGDTTAVDSIGGKDGTLTNSATISGNKLVLDGSSAVELPSDVLDPALTSVTIEAWFQDDSTGNNWARLFDFGQTNGNDGGNGMFCVARQYGTTRFTTATLGTPSWATGEDTVSGPIHPGEETHVACVWDNVAKEVRIYINGELAQSATTRMDLTALVRENAYIGQSSYPGDPHFTGSIDEFRIYNTALTDEDVLSSFIAGPDVTIATGLQAHNPNPRNKATEVSIDVGEITWTPGNLVEAQHGTHNVFIGTDEESVTNATVSDANDLGVTVFPALPVDSNSLALSRLVFGTTYYWRVDEVNNPASTGTNKGNVWNFKTELKGYPLAPEHIINVTANDPAYFDEDAQEPNSTCNGLGLDANDAHGTLQNTMWLAYSDVPGDAYIQYEFDKIYKLNDMLVWNYNEEGGMFGAKDVNITYSQDGVTWTQLDGTKELLPAPGEEGYLADPNNTVDFDGAVAKFVKITFWTGVSEDLPAYGLSEVRFSTMPMRATNLSPQDAANNVAVTDPVLTWKPGRNVVDHYVYISTDFNDVNDRVVEPVIRQDANCVPTLALGETYYWCVDEVNENEAFTTWDGQVQSFSTASSIVVDNFETGYDDTDANAVWATWVDGYGDDNNGSQMGYDTPGPYLSTTNENGGHSAPLLYDNTSASYSEVTAQTVDLPIGTTDWTTGSPTTLVIWIYGDLANDPATDQVYAKIGTAKVPFTGDISKPRWQQFNVDLSTPGIDISNVSSITIGVEKIGATGGTGTVLIDNLRLYREAPTVSTEEIWIEAEDATSLTGRLATIYSDLEGASGGKYIGLPDGSGNVNVNNPPTDGNNVATYTFTVTGGVYSIDYRLYTEGAPGGSDSTYIQIPTATAIKVTNGDDAVLVPDGSTIADGWVRNNNLAMASNWHWDTVISDNNGNRDLRITLPAGTHTLKIAAREDGLFLDAIVIWKVSD